MAFSTSDAKYNFVSEPGDDLVCLICLEVAEDPYQHVDCGRLLCKKCLDKLGKDKPCPNCRKKNPQCFPDNRGKRAIRNLPVKCTNVDRKCEWVGTVGTLDKHVDTCRFTLLSCPKQCNDELFMCEYLNEHLEKYCPYRDHTCEYCGEKGTYVEMTHIHDEVCEMKFIPCVNSDCTSAMPRRDVKEHVTTECEHTVVPCKYKKIGCATQLKRKDMAAHEESNKLHLRMAIKMTVKLEERADKLEKDLKGALDKTDKLEKDLKCAFGKIKALNSISKVGTFTFKLTSYKNKRIRNIFIESPSFYTSPEGYHMQIEVYARGLGPNIGSHVSIFNRLLKGDFDNKLNWPFTGSVTFTLLNQESDCDHITRKQSFEAANNVRPSGQSSVEGLGIYDFCPHSELGPDSVYLKDDALYFRVSVEVTSSKSWLECTAS